MPGDGRSKGGSSKGGSSSQNLSEKKMRKMETKALEEKLGDETKLCAEYGEEMANWLALTDRLSREGNQLRQLSSHTGVLEQDYETLLSDFEEAKREVSG